MERPTEKDRAPAISWLRFCSDHRHQRFPHPSFAYPWRGPSSWLRARGNTYSRGSDRIRQDARGLSTTLDSPPLSQGRSAGQSSGRRLGWFGRHFPEAERLRNASDLCRRNSEITLREYPGILPRSCVAPILTFLDIAPPVVVSPKPR